MHIFSNLNIDKDFDEQSYEHKHPESKFFCQPFCVNNNISNRARLFLHSVLYNNKKHNPEKIKQDKNISLTDLVDLEKIRGKTVVNCYYDDSCSGIGDFLRGCYYLATVAYNQNINFELDLSKHQIGEYIFSKCQKIYNKEDIFDTEKHIPLEKRINNGYVENIQANIINKITSTKDDNIFIFTNYCDSLLGLGDYTKPTKNINEFIRSNFNFTYVIDSKFNSIVSDIKTDEYVTLHFRLGDRKLVYNMIDATNLDPNNINTKDYKVDNKECLNLIIDTFKKTGKTIIVLADSNDFKKYLIQNIPEEFLDYILVPHTSSQHTSNNPGMLRDLKVDTEKKSKNMFFVALDLKILSMSSEIQSYSVYNWGSGFCYWISKMFDVNLIKKDMPLHHE
jgi:hypothetical protein